MNHLTKSVEAFFDEKYERKSTVVAVVRNNEGWELTLEVVTDDEYTKKRAKNDLISVFKVQVDNESKILSYNRVEIRERGKPLSIEEP